MIPIGDYAGARPRFPYVTVALIAINVVVFLFEFAMPEARLDEFLLRWGAVPREIVQGTDVPPTIGLPIYVTLITSIFLHGGWLHLLGNMLYLWIFGDNVENAFGHVKYLLFYVICGLVASLTQIAINTSSTIPTVGASGAIAGVMGAYLVMFPGATVRTLVFVVVFATVIYLPAILVIGFWFLLQLISGVASLGVQAQDSGGVAFWAHIGGLVAGALLAFLFRGRNYQAATPTTYRGYGR
jgi:membrane associated rhomboid family serine protease